MTIPVFIDTFNLAYMTRTRYRGNRIISYERFFTYLRSRYNGDDLDITSYVSRTPNSDDFVEFLQSYGGSFVKQRVISDRSHCNFDVDVAVDVLANVSDKMIICSASLNLVALLKMLSEHKTKVSVHAIGIPEEYRDYCMGTEFGSQAFNYVNQTYDKPLTRLEQQLPANIPKAVLNDVVTESLQPAEPF